MRNKGDVAIRNDTVYVYDKDISTHYMTTGFTYDNFPQIDVSYFKFLGKDKKGKKFAEYLNAMRFVNIPHELHHVEHFMTIIQVPPSQRNRPIWAANELFAKISGNLSGYAHLGSRSKNWDKSFRTKVNISDLNFKIPQNSQKIIDAAIIGALNDMENIPSYRKGFLDCEGFTYDPANEAHAGEQNGTEKEAINKMQNAFKINGKRTDIFSLASDTVRRRAENFINSNDDDMRLVIALHKNNVKF